MIKCKNIYGEKQDVDWKIINKAWVPAITICNTRLFTPALPESTAFNVAILGAMDPQWWFNEEYWTYDGFLDIQENLVNSGFFDSVDYYNVMEETPSLSVLNNYNAIMIFSDGDYDNGEQLGTNIANYVDNGGGVVVTVFELCYNNLLGRWTDEEYYILEADGQIESNNLTLGDTLVANHPVMRNISNFDIGTTGFQAQGNLTENTTVISTFNDDSILAVEKTGFNGRIIGLNFYPPSDRSRADFWDHTTDGGLIMANALKYCGS